MTCDREYHDRPANSQSAVVNRLLFLIPNLELGGAQQSLVRVANTLAETGHTIHVCLARREGELLPKVDSAVRVIDLGGVHHHTIPIGWSRLRRVVQTGGYDCLYSNLWFGSALAHGLIGIQSPRLVAVEHNLVDFYASKVMLGTWKRRYAMHLYRKLFSRIIAVSPPVRDQLHRYLGGGTPITVIPNPVQEPAKSDWKPQDGLSIVSAGRLFKWKQFHKSIQTVELLRGRGYDATLDIYGYGPEGESLQAMAAEVCPEAIRFPGYTTRLSSVLSRSMVYLHPGDNESFGMVVAEAMAAGCPPVLSEGNATVLDRLLDTTNSIVTDGSPESYADAIELLFEDPGLRNDMSRRAISSASRFAGPRHVAHQYLALARES